MEKYAREKNIPVILDDTRLFIEKICAEIRPVNILEIGMAIGYSGAVMLLASPEANITELEASEPNIRIARENYKKLGLFNRVKIIAGDCLNTLSNLKGEKFDLIFLDGPKGKYVEILKQLLPLLAKNGVLLADNVLFRGMVADGKPITENRFSYTVCILREFIDRVTKSPYLNTKIHHIGDGLAEIRLK